MSAMEKVFGLFGRTATPAPAAAPAVSNNLQGTPTNPGTPGNGVVPAATPAPAPAPVSPLEQHKDLWQPVKTEEGDASAPAPLDPKKIMEAASKVDFTKILSQEALAKVQAGGEEAVQAMAALLNQTAQAVYGQSTVAASKIVEQALAQAEQKFAGKVPGLVNQKAAQAKLLTENKALANPAVAPLVDMIQSQLATKYPNATSDELAQMAQDLMKGAASVFAPSAPAKETADKAKKADDDWSDYLS